MIDEEEPISEPEEIVTSVKITNKDKKHEDFPTEEFTIPEYITAEEIKEFEDA